MKYQRLNTKSFIQRAKQAHGNKYDYSKVQYANSKTKITIICNKCGHKWASLPHNHLNGQGCKKCAYDNLAQNQPMTHEEWVERATKTHDGKYEYIDQYKGGKQPIKIKCTVCGFVFNQRANSHLLQGCGCDKCACKDRPQNNPMTIKIFEDRCTSLHCNKYKYNQDYIGNRYKIKIWCKSHKEYFYQEAGAHLYKEQGCPKCRLSRGEIATKKYLDDIGIKHETQKKFDGCLSLKGYPLRFDFYLTALNACIEYDGELHYQSIKAFGGKPRLIETQVNDKIKNEYCESQNISLLRIPFFERPNLSKRIDEFINHLG